MKVLATLILAGVVILGSSHPAAAFKISPFKTAMVPDANATQVYRVENNSDEPIAVQVSVQTWDIQPDGTEVNKDADDDFAVFPAQVVLKARESRAVRIQWLGDTNVKTEKAFRVLAEQVPTNLSGLPDAGSRLKFLLRFKAGLYVAPEGLTAQVRVAGYEPVAGGLRVNVENTGGAHMLLKQPVLTLTLADGRAQKISGDALKALEDANIHAGSTRYFDISVPSDVANSVRGASLDFQPGF